MGRSAKPQSWPASHPWQPASVFQPRITLQTWRKKTGKKQKKPCVLFLRTGRAVRCVLERGEDMLITGARHPVQGKYKVPHHVLFWFEFPMKVIKGLLLVGLKSGFGAAVLGGFHE